MSLKSLDNIDVMILKFKYNIFNKSNILIKGFQKSSNKCYKSLGSYLGASVESGYLSNH